MAYPDNITCRITDDGKEVFATIGELEAEDRAAFESFLDDVDSVSPIDSATGEGPFPSFQLIQLETIGPASVLTKFDEAASFAFDIEVQGNRFTFSVLGADMTTYQDVLDQVNSNISGGTVSYTSMTPSTSHVVVITSNTESQSATDNGDGGGTLSVTSRVKLFKFLNTSFNKADVKTSGGFANVFATLPEYADDHVLTGFSPGRTYTLKIDVESTPYVISGNGVDLYTYDQIIDLITTTIPDATAYYHTDFPRANQISIVGGIDASTIDPADFADKPNPTAAYEAEQSAQVAANFNKTVVISNFDMFDSSPIVHSLKVPVHGGQDLTDVIKYSYRTDKLLWREIIPFEWTEYYWGVAPGT